MLISRFFKMAMIYYYSKRLARAMRKGAVIAGPLTLLLLMAAAAE